MEWDQLKELRRKQVREYRNARLLIAAVLSHRLRDASTEQLLEEAEKLIAANRERPAPKYPSVHPLGLGAFFEVQDSLEPPKVTKPDSPKAIEELEKKVKAQRKKASRPRGWGNQYYRHSGRKRTR